MNFGIIKFVYENEGDHVVGKRKVVHELGGESTIDEVIDEFEHFIKGMGFHLPDGCHIGYEYEEGYENGESNN
jgi:hypothetical protein